MNAFGKRTSAESTEGARATHLPWLTLLTPPNPDSKTGGLTLLIAKRPYRSKFTTITCFCRRRRKDGTCRTLDAVTPVLAHPERVRFHHPKVDLQTFRVPPRTKSASRGMSTPDSSRVSAENHRAPDGETEGL